MSLYLGHRWAWLIGSCRDFTSMDLDDIDAYLDLCQDILLKDREFPSGE